MDDEIEITHRSLLNADINFLEMQMELASLGYTILSAPSDVFNSLYCKYRARWRAR